MAVSRSEIATALKCDIHNHIACNGLHEFTHLYLELFISRACRAGLPADRRYLSTLRNPGQVILRTYSEQSET